jgi:hypothetical protein
VKFNKEDMGLYFALGLVGAGIGLLVGVYVAAKLSAGRDYIPQDEEWDEAAETAASYSVPKIPRMKKLEKKDPNEISEELAAFIAEYQPNAIQIEMIKRELLTFDEVREALVLEETAKMRPPQSYHKYVPEEHDKPDLADLVVLPDEVEIIDNRWEISTEIAKSKSTKNIRMVYYDNIDDDFFIQSRQGRLIPLGSPTELVSDEVWNTIEPYLNSGMGPIYVNDLESPKHFLFEVVSEDLEDSSTDGDAVS